MRRKIVSLFLAVLLMFTMSVSVFAGNDDKVDLRVEVENGQVSLVIVANENTFNGKLVVRFNPTDMTYVGANCAATVYSDQPEKGTVTLGYALSTADTLQAGEEIATLSFVKNNGWKRSVLQVTVENWNDRIGLNQELDNAVAADGTLTPVNPNPAQPTQPAEPTPEVRFDDVPTDSWYEDAVYYCVEQGYLNGIGNNLFGPDMEMNRAMLVTLLARMEGTDTANSQPWYAAGQAWAMENGISDGTNMLGSITREQLVTMLFRYAQMKGYDVSARADLSAYADANAVSDWAGEAMQWAVAVGLIKGTEIGLEPAATATRAQVAQVICRFDGLYRA